MSKENVELVAGVLHAARERPAALWEILDEDVVWEMGALEIPDLGGPVWHGPAAVREFFRRWVGPFDEWTYEVGEVIDAGDSVVAEIRQRGRGKGSGAAVESSFWLTWTIRAGRLVRGSHHWDRDDALAAAG